MIAILLLLLAGIIFGRMIRNHSAGLKVIDRITTASIYLLLLFMGISIGSNNEIVSNLSSLGIKALIITAFSLAGSIFSSLLIYNFFFRNKSEQNINEE